jgi:hypothetical protein
MLKACVLLIAFAVLSHAQNCQLMVPDTPLAATGLATPYQLTNIAGDPNSGTCAMANTGTSTFVQGAVLDLVTSTIKVYNPLVIDAGTTAAATPVTPTLPASSVVALWTGFNGGKLLLANLNTNGITTGNCVNGFGGTQFGEYTYCNAESWFAAANTAILNGSIIPPALGTALDGLTCPSVRNFAVIDQDQSDNVVTNYILTAAGTYAQNIPNNKGLLGTVVANPSDNGLVNNFIYVAFGCTPWKVLDLADVTGTQSVSSLPTNELVAAMHEAAPVALVPVNDPMAALNGAASVEKVNAYRKGVNQPVIQMASQADGLTYCNNFVAAAGPRLANNKARLQAVASPSGVGTLWDFLMNRFTVAYGSAANGGLGCSTLNVANPFTTTANAATTTLIIVIAVAAGGLAVIGAGTAIFIAVKRRSNARTAQNNFMAL